jgi:metallophosphoesterase superfamily enzyme
MAVGGLVFRHEPSPAPGSGEIAGHLHPCKHVTRRGRTIRRRCFASDGLRLVMPAFGAYAGGLDVRDRAVRALFGSAFVSYVLGTRRVYAVAG